MSAGGADSLQGELRHERDGFTSAEGGQHQRRFGSGGKIYFHERLLLLVEVVGKDNVALFADEIVNIYGKRAHQAKGFVVIFVECLIGRAVSDVLQPRAVAIGIEREYERADFAGQIRQGSL